jgi:hypothetical protein
MVDDHAGHREAAQPVDANIALARRRSESNGCHASITAIRVPVFRHMGAC